MKINLDIKNSLDFSGSIDLSLIFRGSNGETLSFLKKVDKDDPNYNDLKKLLKTYVNEIEECIVYLNSDGYVLRKEWYK